jgi:uncharacterized protein
MSENMEKIIVETLKNKVSPFLIYLFGSTANGNLHKDSDIDIAYLSNYENLDKYKLFLIAQEIAAKCNRDVDLIDLNQASTVFRAQVVHTGRVLYCTDNQKKAEFELKTLKMYTKLNEERSPILKNVTESGSIYEK